MNKLKITEEKEIELLLIKYEELWNKITGIYEIWAKKHNTTSSIVFILKESYYSKNCTQKNICDKYLLPKQTVNTILKKLINDELIKLEINKNNKKEKFIKLTTKGKKYIEKILLDLNDMEFKMVKTISKQRFEEMLNIGEDVFENLKQSIEGENK